MVTRKSVIFLAIMLIIVSVYCQGQFAAGQQLTLEDLIGLEYAIYFQPASGDYIVIIYEGEYYLVIIGE